MFFAGLCFGSGKNSIDYTPTNCNKINTIKITNGIYDDLYISENADLTHDTIPVKWDIDTILHASFENNLSGGNVDFQLEEVSALRIKQRKKGTFNWITLFETPVSKLEDLTPTRYSKLERNNIEYEFAIVPILNGAEGNYNVNSILSKFDGIYIFDKENTYHTSIVSTIRDVKKNKPSALITTMGSQYPFSVSVNKINYESFTVEGAFVEFDEANCQFKFEDNVDYRKNFKDWLLNNEAKIIKDFTGRIWMIVVNPDSIVENERNHYLYNVITFNVSEIGNVNSTNDLYYKNFIDVNIERT